MIVTAEREIIRGLPGEPYDGYLDLIALKEENAKLKRQVLDYQARLGEPIGISVAPVASPSSQPLPPPVQPIPTPSPPVTRTYVVKKGDSLYAISRKFYGDSSHIDRIFQANRDSLPSKNSLKVGQTLLIPPAPANR